MNTGMLLNCSVSWTTTAVWIKFAGCVTWILTYKIWKFGWNRCYHYWNTEFFLGDCFYWRKAVKEGAFRTRCGRAFLVLPFDINSPSCSTNNALVVAVASNLSSAAELHKLPEFGINSALHWKSVTTFPRGLIPSLFTSGSPRSHLTSNVYFTMATTKNTALFIYENVISITPQPDLLQSFTEVLKTFASFCSIYFILYVLTLFENNVNVSSE